MPGLIIAIVVGGLAGWIAEQVMKSDMGILMNILLGIAGAATFNFLLSLVGIGGAGGILGYLIAGVIGACLLIWVTRQIRKKT